MDDLIAFLRARLDEDEAVALAASPGPWRPNAENDEVLAVDGITVADGFALSNNQLRATVDHIARWDPARVLAEVEAKQRVLNRYSNDAQYSNFEGGYESAIDDVLADLAAAYAGHPEYRPEWRP